MIYRVFILFPRDVVLTYLTVFSLLSSLLPSLFSSLISSSIGFKGPLISVGADYICILPPEDEDAEKLKCIILTEAQKKHLDKLQIEEHHKRIASPIPALRMQSTNNNNNRNSININNNNNNNNNSNNQSEE